MTTHLLAISIGPVQDFIAAGRRTADLYAGSRLIADLTRVAARAVAERGTLIFPASAEQAAANKILVRVGDEPKDAAAAAHNAAKERLRDLWNEALVRLPADQRGAIDQELARQQVDGFLEWYAAWVPTTEDYRKDRDRVEKLLAGRKALRDFTQPQKTVGRPKSPLDPSRDTVVLGKPDEVCGKRPLSLKASEHLDAVSLLKRVRGADLRDVPSTADMAARSLEADPRHASALEALYQHARPGHVGDLVFAERRDDIRRYEPDRAEAVLRVEAAFGEARLSLPEADPYYAILAADGDRIGERLGKLGEDEHRAFSAVLAAFADSVARAVRQCAGHLVYCGGDDVLAFLPVHTAVACARRLARQFADATGCTLSCGIAIVHYHEPLYATLELAREAESKSKETRDALHLALHTRGGQPRGLTVAWGDTRAFQDWRGAFQAFEGGLSAGLPYEIERLAREADGAALPDGLLREELRRVYERKRKAEGDAAGTGIDSLLGSADSAKDLAALAQRLIIVRWLLRYPVLWEDNP